MHYLLVFFPQYLLACDSCFKLIHILSIYTFLLQYIYGYNANSEYDIIIAALEHVRQFIIAEKLIIYGGQAIDYALRMKGKQIYSDHELPDFDMFSPDSIKHANTLADRLHELGFPCVARIAAIHTGTYRVRINSTFIADITQNSNISSIPTLSYKNMLIIHPLFQRADIHHALSFPFKNPPCEQIYYRYKKDIMRLIILRDLYPVTENPMRIKETTSGIITAINDSLLIGYSAYFLFYQSYQDIMRAAKAQPRDDLSYYPCKINEDGKLINLGGKPIALYTVHLPSKGKIIEAELFRPTVYRTDKYEFYYDPNMLISVTNIPIPTACLHYQLVYFLCRYFLDKDSDALLFYISLLYMMDDVLDLPISSEILAQTPFALPLTTYGIRNTNNSYLAQHAKSVKHVGGEYSGNLPINRTVAEKNFYYD